MPPPENGTRRHIDAPGADWYWEQDDQLRLTYLSSRTSEKTALDLALDLSPYLGHKRCDQRALNLSPEDWDRHRGQLERREPFRDFELQVPADDGRTVWLSLSGEPVFDAGGAFRGYLGAACVEEARPAAAPARERGDVLPRRDRRHPLRARGCAARDMRRRGV